MTFPVLLAGVAIILARIVSIYLVLDNAQYQLLRTKNSSTWIKKEKSLSSRWMRISSLCFWNAKCAQMQSLRFLICIRVVAVVTSPTTLIAAVFAHIDTRFFDFALDVFWANALFELFLDTFILLYAMLLYRARHITKKL